MTSSNGSDGRGDVPRFDDKSDREHGPQGGERPADDGNPAGDGNRAGDGSGRAVEPRSGAKPPDRTDTPGVGRASPSTPPTPGGAEPPRHHGDPEPYPDGLRSARSRVDPARALASRLLLMVPLVIGTVLTEAIFAARGPAGGDVAMVAAVVAFLLAWQGIAWALRSWVAVLLTFVPSVMITLGAAMVGAVEPVGGAILLVIGTTLLLGVVWFRVAAPARRWTPGWSAAPGADAAYDLDALDDGVPDWLASGAAPSSPGSPNRRAGDPPGAAASSGPPGRRTRWDTSGTDIAARDALVLALCQRGGAAGPTVATLEEFFTGNGDPGSIAAPLRGAVPLSTFAAVLHTLRARPDVAEVLVQIEPLAAGHYPAGSWPAAGSVRVVGAVGPDDLDAAVAMLKPAPALGPLPVTRLTDGRPAPAGAGEYAVWWA